MYFINNISYLLKTGSETPKFYLIIFLNFISSFLFFIGFPMLVPALDFLGSGSVTNSFNNSYVNFFFNFLSIDINFYSLVITAAVCIFLGQTFLLLIELFNKHIQIRLINDYMIELIKCYYKSSWMWITNDHSGKFHSIISREVTSASEVHLDSLRFITIIFQILVYLVIAFSLSLLSTFLAVFFFIIIMTFNVFLSKKLNYYGKKNNDANITLSSYVSSLTQNKKFFKASNNYSYFMSMIIRQIETVNFLSWKISLWDGSLRTLSTLAGMMFIIFIFLFHSFININVSSLLLLLLVFSRLIPLFNQFNSFYNRVVERMPVAISVKNRIKEFQDNKELDGLKKLEKNLNIRFKNVSFAYSNNDLVLKGIDLKIENSSITGIIGISGAGKSTFLDLTLGLLRPTSGNIFYNDISHNEINMESLRKKISYVSQETTLIEGTIFFNLTITNPNTNLDTVKSICQKIKINNFIESLPNGYYTDVGENGIRLSGGQRQRLSIARALIDNPDILILDEATSQLDLKTEYEIMDSLQKLKDSMSLIIVSHRIFSVNFADIIYVFKDGNIVEEGSFEELSNNKSNLSLFNELTSKQNK